MGCLRLVVFRVPNLDDVVRSPFNDPPSQLRASIIYISHLHQLPPHHPEILVSSIDRTVMASSLLGTLLAGASVLVPVFASTYANSSFSQVDMLRAQLSLMEDRPDHCPPW